MMIEVDNKLMIHNPTDKVVKWCRQNLILDNPDFYKKERLGKWTGNTPKTICLYESIGNDIMIPFGCVRDLWSLVGNECQWKVKIKPISNIITTSNIKLYNYQEKACVSLISAKNGVLVMPCGSGKTQTGLEFISRVGGRALWLTHTQDLLNQSKERAQNILNIDKSEIGTITGGKVNLGSHITFATVQTLSKLDLLQYRDYWDIIVVDECQHCCGTPTRVTQFYKVLSNLSARYKVGLTATPKRADGLEKAMYALLGGIVHEVTREEVAHTTCPTEVQLIPTNWVPDYDCVLTSDGTIDYSRLIENMVNDEDRFNLIVDFVAKIPPNQPIMVLGNRVNYLERLCSKCGEFKACKCISGMSKNKKSKRERKQALKDLNDGKFQCLFATYQLAKEGLDVPNLRYLIMATPEQDYTTVVQSVGRVGRKADGKTHGVVIDFVDKFGMYEKWAKKRKGYYKKIGAEIK